MPPRGSQANESAWRILKGKGKGAWLRQGRARISLEESAAAPHALSALPRFIWLVLLAQNRKEQAYELVLVLAIWPAMGERGFFGSFFSILFYNRMLGGYKSLVDASN